MSLRKRLVTAMLAAILVPVLLITFICIAVTGVQLRSIKDVYGIEGTSLFVGSSMEAINQMTKHVQDQLVITAHDDPERLTDSDFLDDLNRQLLDKYSYLLVRLDEEVIYTGSQYNTVQIEELPVFRDSADMVYLDNQKLFLNRTNFEMSDGTEGSAFIVTNRSNVIPELQAIIFELILAVLSILVISALIFSMWIYRDMIRPIHELRTATRKIKDGNLDFELNRLDVKEGDEIGELFSDFDEMKSRLKESMEEKIQNDKDNKELIRNISHDLKTPITSIKGYVEGIRDGVADTPEKVERYLKTIYNKANDMDNLIDELAYYSRVDTNRVAYSFTKLQVKDYFDDCTEEVGLDLEAKDIRFNYVNYCDEDTLIIADPEQLKKVINNIIGNSVKYMDKENPRINMRVSDVGDFIQVEIEDNGKGIGQKEIPYIFDRFYRTDSSRNSTRGGSGIGLSIVKKIIEDHNGKVWATSKEGIGTVICFVIRKYQEVYYE